MSILPGGLPGSENVFTCPVRFDFYTRLQAKLQTAAKVVPVFDKAKMQGERGAVAAVDMPQGRLLRCCTTVDVLLDAAPPPPSGTGPRSLALGLTRVCSVPPPRRAVRLHGAAARRVPDVSGPERLVLRPLGSHGAALRLLRSARPVLRRGAGPVDHRLPQVAAARQNRRLGPTS